VARTKTGTKLARRVPNSAAAGKKPRAWRINESPLGAQPSWSPARVLILAGVVALFIGGIFALFAGGAFGAPAGSRTTPTQAASPQASSRQIVSSTLGGEAPIVSPTPLTVIPAPATGGAPAQSADSTAQAQFSPAPPVAVQQVQPATGRQPAPASAAPAASASPTLPGTVVPSSAPAAAAGGPSPAGSSNGVASSIQSDLNAMDASAAALAQQAGVLSSPATPQTSGTPRPAPTETPIPTAAPPIPPSA